jgi:hypothetical protein
MPDGITFSGTGKLPYDFSDMLLYSKPVLFHNILSAFIFLWLYVIEGFFISSKNHGLHMKKLITFRTIEQ